MNQLLNLTQEPRVNPCNLVHLPDGNAQFHGIVQVEQSIPTGMLQAV